MFLANFLAAFRSLFFQEEEILNVSRIFNVSKNEKNTFLGQIMTPKHYPGTNVKRKPDIKCPKIFRKSLCLFFVFI